MRTRGLLIAAAVLVVLAGGVYWSNRHPKADENKASTDTAPKILSVPEDQVTQIAIKRKDGSETVVKRSGSKWELAAPKPAGVDADAVNGVASTLSSLSSDRVVEDKASDLSSYGLNAPSVEVDVTKKDGKTQKILIGDDTPTGSSVYVMVAGDPKVYTMSSSLKSSLDKNWQDLRDKRLLTFDSDKLTRVELAAKKSDVEFGKNNQNEWTILRPKPLRADGGQVEELIRKLKDAKMDTSASEEDAKKAAAAFAGGTPVATAKVTDASGTQTLDVRKSKEDYYAKSSVVDGIHKVAADLGTGLDKGVDDFRNKKLFDFGFSEPSKIEVKNGAAAPVTYQKSGEKWFNGPKQIDSTSLQNFLDKARDLSASKFVETAPGAPVFEVTITSGDGKRVEKVTLSKSGNDYLAKREGEPSVYQIESKAAEDFMTAAKDIKEAPPEKKK
jgi:hypothetical protein